MTEQNKDGRYGASDSETQEALGSLNGLERLQSNRVPGVRTVLVVLSSTGMVYDVESLRQKILLVYPDATVFFKTTSGKSIGASSFKTVDLLIDLTGPGNRQNWFYPRKLRSMARVTVGRNAGLFRKSIYDRIYDEKAIIDQLPKGDLDRERKVQQEVLAMAGVPMMPAGDATEDQARSIALDLPPLSHR